MGSRGKSRCGIESVGRQRSRSRRFSVRKKIGDGLEEAYGGGAFHGPADVGME